MTETETRARASDVLIIGGGSAAVWAAAPAARRRREAGVRAEDLSIALVAPDHDLVIRPRLYEARPDEMRVPLRRLLAPIDVHHLRASVEEVDVRRRHVFAAGSGGGRVRERFGRLVVTAGSRLVRSDALPGADRLYDIDTLPRAVALDEHLHRLPSRPVAEGRYVVVVIGAGFVGLELPTELVTRLRTIAAPHGAADQVRIVLVERAPIMGPELGPGPHRSIEDALDELGIERRLATTVTGPDDTVVRLSDGTAIPTLTAVWTAGMQASPITRSVPGHHDVLGRLEVDRHLRVTGVEQVFAAGDTAANRARLRPAPSAGLPVRLQMGKHAGHSAVSDLLELPLGRVRAGPRRA